MSDAALAAFAALREQLGQAVIGQPAVVEALIAEHPWTLLKGSRGMGLERVWAGLSGEGRGVH